MQCWINVHATGRIDDKTKMANILLKTNIPSFQHSIIPFLGQIRNPQKTLYYLQVVKIPRCLICWFEAKFPFLYELGIGPALVKLTFERKD
jgi:hypothetical protein